MFLRETFLLTVDTDAGEFAIVISSLLLSVTAEFKTRVCVPES